MQKASASMQPVGGDGDSTEHWRLLKTTQIYAHYAPSTREVQVINEAFALPGRSSSARRRSTRRRQWLAPRGRGARDRASNIAARLASMTVAYVAPLAAAER